MKWFSFKKKKKEDAKDENASAAANAAAAAGNVPPGPTSSVAVNGYGNGPFGVDSSQGALQMRHVQLMGGAANGSPTAHPLVIQNRKDPQANKEVDWARIGEPTPTQLRHLNPFRNALVVRLCDVVTAAGKRCAALVVTPMHIFICNPVNGVVQRAILVSKVKCLCVCHRFFTLQPANMSDLIIELSRYPENADTHHESVISIIDYVLDHRGQDTYRMEVYRSPAWFSQLVTTEKELYSLPKNPDPLEHGPTIASFYPQYKVTSPQPLPEYSENGNELMMMSQERMDAGTQTELGPEMMHTNSFYRQDTLARSVQVERALAAQSIERGSPSSLQATPQRNALSALTLETCSDEPRSVSSSIMRLLSSSQIPHSKQTSAVTGKASREASAQLSETSPQQQQQHQQQQRHVEEQHQQQLPKGARTQNPATFFFRFPGLTRRSASTRLPGIAQPRFPEYFPTEVDKMNRALKRLPSENQITDPPRRKHSLSSSTTPNKVYMDPEEDGDFYNGASSSGMSPIPSSHSSCGVGGSFQNHRNSVPRSAVRRRSRGLRGSEQNVAEHGCHNPECDRSAQVAWRQVIGEAASRLMPFQLSSWRGGSKARQSKMLEIPHLQRSYDQEATDAFSSNIRYPRFESNDPVYFTDAHTQIPNCQPFTTAELISTSNARSQLFCALLLDAVAFSQAPLGTGERRYPCVFMRPYEAVPPLYRELFLSSCKGEQLPGFAAAFRNQFVDVLPSDVFKCTDTLVPVPCASNAALVDYPSKCFPLSFCVAFELVWLEHYGCHLTVYSKEHYACCSLPRGLTERSEPRVQVQYVPPVFADFVARRLPRGNVRPPPPPPDPNAAADDNDDFDEISRIMDASFSSSNSSNDGGYDGEKYRRQPLTTKEGAPGEYGNDVADLERLLLNGADRRKKDKKSESDFKLQRHHLKQTTATTQTANSIIHIVIHSATEYLGQLPLRETKERAMVERETTISTWSELVDLWERQSMRQ